jgi:hypothetical protein
LCRGPTVKLPEYAWHKTDKKGQVKLVSIVPLDKFVELIPNDPSHAEHLPLKACHAVSLVAAAGSISTPVVSSQSLGHNHGIGVLSRVLVAHALASRIHGLHSCPVGVAPQHHHPLWTLVTEPIAAEDGIRVVLTQEYTL